MIVVRGPGGPGSSALLRHEPVGGQSTNLARALRQVAHRKRGGDQSEAGKYEPQRQAPWPIAKSDVMAPGRNVYHEQLVLLGNHTRVAPPPAVVGSVEKDPGALVSHHVEGERVLCPMRGLDNRPSARCRPCLRDIAFPHRRSHTEGPLVPAG